MAQVVNYTENDGLFIGDDLSLRFIIFGDDLILDPDGNYVSGTPEDVGAWDFEFVVRKSDTTTEDPIIMKTSADGIAVSGTYNADPNLNTQIVTVTILDTDTSPDGGTPVKAKTWRHALKRTNAGLEKTLAYGNFPLQETAAR